MFLERPRVLMCVLSGVSLVFEAVFGTRLLIHGIVL